VHFLSIACWITTTRVAGDICGSSPHAQRRAVAGGSEETRASRKHTSVVQPGIGVHPGEHRRRARAEEVVEQVDGVPDSVQPSAFESIRVCSRIDQASRHGRRRGSVVGVEGTRRATTSAMSASRRRSWCPAPEPGTVDRSLAENASSALGCHPPSRATGRRAVSRERPGSASAVPSRGTRSLVGELEESDAGPNWSAIESVVAEPPSYSPAICSSARVVGGRRREVFTDDDDHRAQQRHRASAKRTGSRRRTSPGRGRSGRRSCSGPR